MRETCSGTSLSGSNDGTVFSFSSFFFMYPHVWFLVSRLTVHAVL